MPEDDPLGVLASTRAVVDAAVRVRIDDARVAAVAAMLGRELAAPPAWDDALHFRDGTWRTAAWVLVLDALNFCFWSDDPDPDRRWRVAFQGQTSNGYQALAAALTRAVAEGKPLWDAAYLATMTRDELSGILRGDPDQTGSPAIPLFDDRLANVRELGRGLLDRFPGDAPVVELIGGADGSAVRLVRRVADCFPSFDDVASYGGYEVRFYKRAQIFVADLYGAFEGKGFGAFGDLQRLTAFADYKVPQVLRWLGVLVYDAALASTVARREPLAPGSAAEVEIRAATVWACELIRRALREHGRTLRAFEIDWALWTAGQTMPTDAPPYHRTRTVFY